MQRSPCLRRSQDLPFFAGGVCGERRRARGAAPRSKGEKKRNHRWRRVDARPFLRSVFDARAVGFGSLLYARYGRLRLLFTRDSKSKQKRRKRGERQRFPSPPPQKTRGNHLSHEPSLNLAPPSLSQPSRQLPPLLPRPRRRRASTRTPGATSTGPTSRARTPLASSCPIPSSSGAGPPAPTAP